MNDCIILVSHSNYRIRSAGVEKYIGEITELFQRKEIQSIQFFPIIEVNKRSRIFGKEYVGVHYNGKFEGIYREDALAVLLNQLGKKYGLNYLGVHINHLHGWNVNYLEALLLRLKLPVKIIVHDYEMICEYMLKEDGCGASCRKKVEKPCAERCADCRYAESARRQFQRNRDFLAHIEPLIEGVVAPSKVAGANWLNGFENYRNKLTVREHLRLSGNYVKNEPGEKLKIAYVGSVATHKGYNEWLRLQESLEGQNFEFYYFGKSEQPMPGVQKVYVDFQVSASKSMSEQIREYGIDFAFIWSTWHETYCYTAYEAFAAGCYLLTNNYSGNIADMVESTGCGKVCATLEECVVFLKDSDDARMKLADYRNAKKVPAIITPNTSLEELMFQGDPACSIVYVSGHVRRCELLSAVYSLMRCMSYR